MASRILRRSGAAVCIVAERLGWDADLIIQVGVGFHHKEIDVMKSEKWPDAELIGYEPNPKIFIGIDGKYPGTVINKAVSSKSGVMSLWEKKAHKDGSSLKKFNGTNRKLFEHTVYVTTLDEQISCRFSTDGNILLWLDCEGSELDVLNGATTLLGHVDMINIEMTSDPPSDEWPDTRVVHNKLRDHGFFRQYLHTMKGNQYDAIYVKPKLFDSRFCCCPFSIDEYEKEFGLK